MTTFCGEMDELASKLFKTFFQSKKSFLSSENELVEVASKMDIFRKSCMVRAPDPHMSVNSVIPCEKIRKNSVHFFLINLRKLERAGTSPWEYIEFI